MAGGISIHVYDVSRGVPAFQTPQSKFRRIFDERRLAFPE